MYIRLLYVDCGLDNKETFAKEHMWTLFNSTLTDITKVYCTCMLIKQPTLAVERKEEKREEGYKGLHSGLTITGLTIYYA